ncbi:hypothetical protein SAMN05519104_4778 [Rhizobiales bacterium GAS188]|nr:hypothetical protein SAMN05519104_4778 [Rhizobiales bacterium GAS188]
MAAPKRLDSVPVGRIFLNLSNPRHVEFETEGQAIAFLCDNEYVHPLARDIVMHGLNPLENFAVIPVDKRNAAAGYYIVEGNRRFCALKLLSDPDLAPAKLRKSFQKLSDEWDAPLKTVPAVLFPTLDDVKVWLDRIHGGLQGGIGRKEWNAEQKTRAHGENKNKAAQALLDYAQDSNMISEDERRKRLTTVQRFLSNGVFRETLGFDQNNPDAVARTRPEAEFNKILTRFMRDIVEGQATSRMNRDEIVQYARPLAHLSGVTNARVEPEPLQIGSGASKTKKDRRAKPGKPEKVKHVQYEQEIFEALTGLRNSKLRSLYHSICAVDLDPHTPLIAVGAWCFFETLTACAGRTDSTSFDSFLSKQKLLSYGIAGDTLSLRNALGRMREYGNTTKHHPLAATFNGDQLNNDMVALKSVILKCIEEAAAKGS